MKSDKPRIKSKTKLYKVWSAMKERCFKTKHPKYKNYGGRGIKVCDRWRNSFDKFKADVGDRPTEGHSLDRINNDGNYEPANCRWATREQQARNKRNSKYYTYEGKTQTIRDWADEYAMDPELAAQRAKRGWCIERILKTPKIEYPKMFDYGFESRSMQSWADKLRVSRSFIYRRISKGKSMEEVVRDAEAKSGFQFQPFVMDMEKNEKELRELAEADGIDFDDMMKKASRHFE